MKQIVFFALLTVTLFNLSCKTTKTASATRTDDGKIEVVFVQINDVYEIAPVSNGREGGMARVAALKKQYLKDNKNTFLVMSGDFVSPSVYNSIKYNDKRIRGAQMIESMNAAGMDYVTFGNHEFDIAENELQERINESTFSWIASNTFHKTKAGIVPFKPAGAASFPEKMIVTVRDNDGTVAKIGYIGLTIPSNPADYVSYADPITTGKRLYAEIKDSVDAVVAITHLAVEDDKRLAQEVPGLAAILGGHEHGGVFEKQGEVYITKAQSNARTAYVVKLNIDKRKHSIKVLPKVVDINENIPLDPGTDSIVTKWKKIAENNYASLGFEARKVVMASGEPLDGRESEIRSRSTNLTSLITAAMANACPQADVVIFNSGSVRLDDILTPPITQYDIIRTLPFGGGIREVDMKGSMLLQVLQTGLKNKDNGGYLQSQPTRYFPTHDAFTVNNRPIIPNQIYRVAVSDFLLTGKETNLAFLNEKNTDIVKVYPAETNVGNPKSDIRTAVINYLEGRK